MMFDTTNPETSSEAARMSDADLAAWFVVWRAGQARKREDRRLELADALRAGRKVAECLGHGAPRVWPDCSPFVAACNTPEYLAAHLESREYGFGTSLEIVP